MQRIDRQPKYSLADLIMRNLLLLIILLMVYSPIYATTVKKLYEVSVPVFSQSDKERKEAIKLAFEELLIRVTGKSTIADSDEGTSLIKNARRYIRSFRYEMIEKKVVELIPESDLTLESDLVTDDQQEIVVDTPAIDELEPEAPQPEQNLVVLFDEKAVKNILWKNKLPVWGKTRPATLIWLAVQDQDTRQLIDASEPRQLLEHMGKYAKKRGLPILYPLLDLEDQLNLNITDVWGGFKEPVTRASERYQPEAIVAVRLYLDPFEMWESRWSFYQGSEEYQWRSTATDLETAVREGIDALASKLAERYAHVPSSGDENGTFIYIADVTTLSEYDKVTRYLSSLPAVKKVFVSQVQTDEIVYQLDLRGSKAALKQAIALSKVLSEIEDPFAIDLPESRFNYRLMP